MLTFELVNTHLHSFDSKCKIPGMGYHLERMERLGEKLYQLTPDLNLLLCQLWIPKVVY